MSADEKTTAQSQFDNAVESQFKNIGEIVEKGEGDDEDLGPMQVESMCMNCHENVSFDCDNRNDFEVLRILIASRIMIGNYPSASHPRALFPRYHSRIF